MWRLISSPLTPPNLRNLLFINAATFIVPRIVSWNQRTLCRNFLTLWVSFGEGQFAGVHLNKTSSPFPPIRNFLVLLRQPSVMCPQSREKGYGVGSIDKLQELLHLTPILGHLQYRHIFIAIGAYVCLGGAGDMHGNLAAGLVMYNIVHSQGEVAKEGEQRLKIVGILRIGHGRPIECGGQQPVHAVGRPDGKDRRERLGVVGVNGSVRGFKTGRGGHCHCASFLQGKLFLCTGES